MTSPAEAETSERYMAVARRWFTEGWTGDLAMADDIFSEDLRTNGVHAGVAGPVGQPLWSRRRAARLDLPVASISREEADAHSASWLPSSRSTTRPPAP
jgi:hypothetical protein